MSIFGAIVLGLVQGLTEFLPISSTAHLRLVPAFAGWEDPGAAFTSVTQLGTIVAVLIYFRGELWRIARSWMASLAERDLVRRDLDARIGWFIVLATVPIGLFGWLFQDQIETGARDLYLIGVTLIALGLALLAAEKLGSRSRGMDQLRVKDGLIIGLAQSLALVPGVSRAGATITAGLFMGLDRPTAARFSFMLSVPAVVLSGLFELGTVLAEGDPADSDALSLAVATLMAFASGYVTIAALLRYLEHHSTGVFVAYRVALGLVGADACGGRGH